jgi:hypothetical protein
MNQILRINQAKIARLDRASIITRQMGMRGRYKIEAVNAESGKRRVLADWFPNLITNAGLDRLAASNPLYLQNCYVGTGNTTPAFANTALVSLLASTNTFQATSAAMASTSPYFSTRTNTYRFAQGAAAGNVAEVGIGNTSTNLFSRALILDGTGAPTTITVLSTEFLDVTYAFEVIVPLVDVTGTVVIVGVSYAYTLRAAAATNAANWCPSQTGSPMGYVTMPVYSGAIGTILTSPAGTAANADSLVTATYVATNLFLDTTATYGLNTANFGAGGITALTGATTPSSNGIGAFQVGFSPFIPKDATHILTLTMRNSWVRM